jgi:hypothetical protein
MACMRTLGAIPKICSNVVHFRWSKGTVTPELPGEGESRTWYTITEHPLRILTETERSICKRFIWISCQLAANVGIIALTRIKHNYRKVN